VLDSEIANYLTEELICRNVTTVKMAPPNVRNAMAKADLAVACLLHRRSARIVMALARLSVVSATAKVGFRGSHATTTYVKR
jgi:hypothetical protein